MPYLRHKSILSKEKLLKGEENLVFTSLHHSRVVFKRKTETSCGFCFRGWNLEEKVENAKPLQPQ